MIPRNLLDDAQLHKAEYLITMGLHPSEILQGYELARDKALEELESELRRSASCGVGWGALHKRAEGHEAGGGSHRGRHDGGDGSERQVARRHVLLSGRPC